MKFKNIAMILFAAALSSQAFALTLTLWEHEKEDDQKVLDEITARFSKANPGIKIKRSHYKTEDLRTQFQTAAMGGGGADIVLAPNDFAGPFSVMRIIKPVGALVDKDKFYPSVVQAVTDAKKEMWGIPVTNGNHLMLFVNKGLIKNVPSTIEELVKEAKAMSQPEKSIYGFAYNLNEPFWFVTFLGAYGERPLVDAKPVLNSDGMIKALELVKSFKFADKIVPPDCDYSCAETLFLEGKAGMIINGDWAVGKYKDALKANLAIAPLPQLKATGKFMAPMVSGKYLFLNDKLKGKKFAAAKSFATFMTSPGIQSYLVERSGRLPALKAVGTSKVVTGNPLVNAALKAAEHGQPMPMEVEMRAVWDSIRPQLQKVMAGREEPKKAALSMQKNAELKIMEMTQ